MLVEKKMTFKNKKRKMKHKKERKKSLVQFGIFRMFKKPRQSSDDLFT